MKFKEAILTSTFVKHPSWESGAVQRVMGEEDLLVSLQTGTVAAYPDFEMDGWIPCFASGEPV